jgi:uncharacterized membrane protein YfcA
MSVTGNVLIFVIVGFAAQMIDGALGMAYGVSSNTFLLSVGVPPALASASVHAAEMFTTAVSGLSHLRLGNVDRALFKRLLIPGIIGGILGSYVLTTVPGGIVKPFVAVYLLVMGCIILRKALKKSKEREVHTKLAPLGAVGGFFDAVGGGGWGPIVTTTLVARGNNPRFAIGSVNMAEFFVTVAESVTFTLTIGQDLVQNWQVVVGLLGGGVLAAPLAAYLCKRLPAQALMIIVGALIVVLQLRTLYLVVSSSGLF